ncbi:AraC-type DNA-binding protein [Pelagirhabdus alkalitolerans]|uniref:AraC-type DNA-binding protein n=1 Tax=Pelagirhabdus alkalitolerans TaxID=1612202 RepID=A0A1G6GSC8_9BACI|nr:AraC family transcriptional regulator [Pelagirhabdus alkalitolerans]SDB84076.1 AraC-type DNA-binding protein [Pelagirhabdus alkalitolerans]
MNEQHSLNKISDPHVHNQSGFISYGHKPANAHKWGPGVRDVYAMHYIIKGKGVFSTRKDTFHLEAGDSFIIFPYMEIYYYPDAEDPWEYVWVEFNGEEAMRLLEQTTLSIDRPIALKSPKCLKSLFEITENDPMKPFVKARCDAKLRMLLSYYMEYYPRKTHASQIDYVEQAKQFIHHHYWKNTLRVSDIVDAVNIERSYLFRLFKDATGLSISSYLTSYRVEQACELLSSSDLSIKSVAYSVGYKDPLYFSRVFKKTVSQTPSAYVTQVSHVNETTHTSQNLDNIE